MEFPKTGRNFEKGRKVMTAAESTRRKEKGSRREGE